MKTNRRNTIFVIAATVIFVVIVALLIIFSAVGLFDKNTLSVTYQTVDENARLVGYETDLGTLKRHLVSALNMGENVIIGSRWRCEVRITENGTIAWHRAEPISTASQLKKYRENQLYGPHEI